MRNFVAVLAFTVAHGTVLAQQNNAATTRSVQEQQARQQAVRNQQAQEQVHEQIRQNNADALKRSSQDNPGLSRQLDQADQAANQQYQARQRDLRDAYQRAQVPPPRTTSNPTPSRGH